MQSFNLHSKVLSYVSYWCHQLDLFMYVCLKKNASNNAIHLNKKNIYDINFWSKEKYLYCSMDDTIFQYQLAFNDVRNIRIHLLFVINKFFTVHCVRVLKFFKQLLLFVVQLVHCLYKELFHFFCVSDLSQK